MNYIWLQRDLDKRSFFRDFTTEKAHGYLECLPAYKPVRTKIESIIEKAVLGNSLRMLIPEWMRVYYYNIDHYDYKDNEEYTILCSTQVIARYSEQYLRKFRGKHTNIRLYAVVCDSMHASSTHMDFVRDKLLSGVFDRVLTYDRYDADEFGFDWFGYTYYSETPFEEEKDGIKNDVYFVGIDKGERNKIIYSLYDYFIAHGIKAQFDIPKVKNPHKGFVYMEKGIPYAEVLKRVSASNVIIEILQEKQQVQSVRYFEAVRYNKKLLTNNKHLYDLPYYDARYMRSFDQFEDIDLDWIKKKETIDYGYKGDFSPMGLLAYLEKLNRLDRT